MKMSFSHGDPPAATGIDCWSITFDREHIKSSNIIRGNIALSFTVVIIIILHFFAKKYLLCGCRWRKCIFAGLRCM